MPRTRIESLDDTRLAVYRDLKTTNATRGSNVMIAEGTTLVERLFQSDYEVQSVLVSEQKLRNFAERIPSDVVVYEVPRDLASRLVGFKFHVGVAAAAVRRPPPQLADCIPHKGPAMVMFCHHVIDPQNVGMIIRVGSAFGAAAVVLSSGCADPWSRRVLRVSMGNGFFLPVVEDVSSTDAIQTLKLAGFQCCAAVLDEAAQDLSTFTFPERSVIVFGNETHGVDDDVVQRCEHRVTIPMLNGTDSVNVSVATGIFAFAYRRQYPSAH